MELNECTVGAWDTLRKEYDRQIATGTREDYVWEFSLSSGQWSECFGFGKPCSPNWNCDSEYRFKRKVKVNDNITEIEELKSKIVALEEKLTDIRTDYKIADNNAKKLIIDLVPMLNKDQLKFVCSRTGSWLTAVVDGDSLSYFVRYDV